MKNDDKVIHAYRTITVKTKRETAYDVPPLWVRVLITASTILLIIVCVFGWYALLHAVLGSPAHGELWQYRDEPQVEYARSGNQCRATITHIYPHKPEWELRNEDGEVLRKGKHDSFYFLLTEEWQYAEVSFPWDDGNVYYIGARVRLNDNTLEVEPLENSKLQGGTDENGSG